MLESSAKLARTPVEYSSAMPDPDDFDEQLRNLTSGQAEPAKFTELSAAERARRNSATPPPPAKLSWRKARKAKQLRKPFDEPGPKSPGSKNSKRRLSAVGSPQRGSPQRKAKPAGGRRRPLLAIARVVGVLVAFAALLYGLHLLGFGPQ
jgi:hypothetical protein